MSFASQYYGCYLCEPLPTSVFCWLHWLNWQSQWDICNVLRALSYILCIRLILSRSSHLKYCLNKVKIGCRSDKEIVLWKIRSGLFPSIGSNCNLWKAKWRVTQNLAETPRGTSFCWQWFCQLWSMERSPPNLETFEDSLCCGAGAQTIRFCWLHFGVFDDIQSVFSVVCLRCCFSFIFLFYFKCRSALIQI